MTGNDTLDLWLASFAVVGIAAGIWSGFFKARKIQPRGFKWTIFRNEIIFGIVNVAVSGTIIGFVTRTLTAQGIIATHHGPTVWWVIALEYTAYFFAFDTWFYWLHRGMHKEPFYSLIHKLHHRSTSPNLMTTISVNPLESLINGGFVPIFLAALTVHEATLALILPTNIIMGLYVHSGYEFLPRWWNRSWATKWFITTTFHDQHHKYFNFNFGGYTTIWDWLCGTVRPKFVADFEKPRAAADKMRAASHPSTTEA